MYERRNEYLKRREERMRGGQDYRYRQDGNDYARGNMNRRRDGNDYYGGTGYPSRRYDARYEPDYRYANDYNGYSNRDGNYEKTYEEDLHKWIEKLKRKDRLGTPKEQVLKQAKNMGIKFDEFSEEEFYAVYLAMVTDYKTVSNDYNVYIQLAKDFLYDDDMAVSPSEKVCIYMYSIVLGEY